MPAPASVAQHVLAQSAELRHAPPMNWAPLPLPTFLAPEGSGDNGEGLGRANAVEANAARRTATVFVIATILSAGGDSRDGYDGRDCCDEAIGIAVL